MRERQLGLPLATMHLRPVQLPAVSHRAKATHRQYSRVDTCSPNAVGYTARAEVWHTHPGYKSDNRLRKAVMHDLRDCGQ